MAEAGYDVTIIGTGMHIEGTLKVQGDVRIGGKIIGQVKVDGKVIMTQEGVVEGEIVSKTAEIAHKLQGDLTVSESLILRNTALIEGDIQSPRLTVEEGAKLIGSCKIGSK